MEKTVRTSVIIAVIAAITALSFIITQVQKEENYAALYLIPESYTNYIESDTLALSFGIKQYGKPSSRYNLEVYLGEKLIAERDLTAQAGENELVLKVPKNMRYPQKVKLVLTTDYGKNQVHFWLKGRKENIE